MDLIDVYYRAIAVDQAQSMPCCDASASMESGELERPSLESDLILSDSHTKQSYLCLVSEGSTGPKSGI